MYSINDIQNKLKSQEISCREITDAYLKAAHASQKKINAFTLITDDEALNAADVTDKKIASGEELSPIEGVPFVLKDNIATKGIPTTCASKMLINHVPIYDAFVWTQLKKSGAVLIGKGNMDEFAMGSTCETSYFGGAKNPHDLSKVAGGSSGGAAAAVAGNVSVFGIGSDTGGSIRQPASFCGLVGLKPTYGAVSRNGLIAYASSFDQIGPIASCTADCACVYEAISKKDSDDMTCKGGTRLSLTDNIKGIRIGIADEFFEGLNSDLQQSLEDAVDTYRKLGAEIIKVNFPMLKYVLPVYYILACAEASSNLGRYDGLRYGYRAEHFENLDDFICKTRTEGFGDEVKRRIILGTYVLSSGYYDAYYKKALALSRTVKACFSQIFDSCDLLLTPTVPVTAIRSGERLSPVEMYQTDICTVSVNIAGLPALSCPCGFDKSNMPIGMQLIGNAFSENEILSASLAFERYTEGAYLRDTGMGVTL